MRSRLVALGLVWGCLGVGVIAACGGDDDGSGSSSGGTNDASIDNNPPSNDGSSTAPTISAQNLTIYTGMTAALDASGTAAQTFAWTVKTAPAGSTVSTATLTSATTARPSFRADKSGDYVLTLTAKNGDAAATKDVTVKAVPAPLFYMQSNFSEKPPYFEYRMVGTDGTGGHPVACRTNGDPDGGSDQAGFFLQQSLLLSDMGEDWWESPNAAEPSRVAFVNFERIVDAGTESFVASLAIGTNASTCQSPPVKVTGIGSDAGNNNGINLLQPRFNHAGTRVAFIEVRDDVWFIMSVAYDGKDRRQLGQMCDGENQCSNPSIFPARPQWLNDTTVGWARKQGPDAGGTDWEVVTASDSANPNPQVYMTCDGLAPRSIAFLKDGSVLANRQAPDAGSKEDLWILKPNATTKKCDVVRNLTNLPQDWSYARDFSISPDESEVAFVRFIQDGGKLPDGGGTRLGGELYVGPISGGSAPVPAGSTPQAALFGPRYVAGASALAFNGLVVNDGGGASDEAGAAIGGFIDGGVPVIAVLPREGGAPTYAVRSDIEAGTYVFGGGNGGACDFRLDLCSTVPMSMRGNGPLFFVGAFGALLLRRRRRNRKG